LAHRLKLEVMKTALLLAIKYQAKTQHTVPYHNI